MMQNSIDTAALHTDCQAYVKELMTDSVVSYSHNTLTYLYIKYPPYLVDQTVAKLLSKS